MVRQMKAMVAAGELGAIRTVVANFSHGHHAAGDDAENPRVRWRYDPAQAGVSGQMADCGIHALHMASFVTGDEVEKLSADFASTVKGRVLEDDAMVNFRTTKGTVGRLWTSTIALGRQHGLDIAVYGEKGGMRWASEQPNQIIYNRLGGRTEIIEKGEAGLSEDAQRMSRVAIAHPEGFPLAVANIYVDLAAKLRGEAKGNLPTAEDGLRSMAAVFAAVESASKDGAWVDARPAMFR
jgi:predicted dehydrogenase